MHTLCHTLYYVCLCPGCPDGAALAYFAKGAALDEFHGLKFAFPAV